MRRPIPRLWDAQLQLATRSEVGPTPAVAFVDAVLTDEDIIAIVPDERVVAGSTSQHVGTIATDQEIVALATVQVETDQARQAHRARDYVIAALAIDVQRLSGADVEHEQAQVVPLEPDSVPVGDDGEVVTGAVGAIDLHSVNIGATFHKVTAVAVVPDEQIVPILTELDIVAPAPEENVVACSTS